MLQKYRVGLFICKTKRQRDSYRPEEERKIKRDKKIER